MLYWIVQAKHLGDSNEKIEKLDNRTTWITHKHNNTHCVTSGTKPVNVLTVNFYNLTLHNLTFYIFDTLI